MFEKNSYYFSWNDLYCFYYVGSVISNNINLHSPVKNSKYT